MIFAWNSTLSSIYHKSKRFSLRIRSILLTPVRIFRARIVPEDSACTQVAGAFLMKSLSIEEQPFSALFVASHGPGTPF